MGKKSLVQEKSPAQGANVRRSIGKWEAAKTDTTPTTANTVTQAGPSKTKSKLTLSQDIKTTTARKTGAESSSPLKKCTNQVAEARAWLTKAKLHLNNSRNLKNDLKVGIIEAIDRLYQLVKDAKANRPRGENEKNHHTEPETTPATDESLLETPSNLLMERMEEHSKLLKINNKKIGELNEKMQKQMESMELAASRTYASVTVSHSGKPAQIRNTLHSVVVTSKDETETGEVVLAKVRKAVDAKDGWIKVEKIRKAKDRKIIMGFSSKEEREKMKNRLGKEGVDLTIEEVKNRDPLLILKNVLLINTDEDVLKALRNQNRGVFGGLEDGNDRLEIKYRRRTRNPHTGHVIISVSPIIWQRAVEAGSVHIDLQRIRVEDQSPLVQCTRCLGFGHGKKFCTEPADLCSHCGGPHLRADCTDWLTGAKSQCRNCSKANMDNVDHNAFSHDCVTRRRWDELARSTVAYC